MAQFRPKFGQKWSFLGSKNRQKVAILGPKIGSRFYQNSCRLTDLENRQFADFSAELATPLKSEPNFCYSSGCLHSLRERERDTNAPAVLQIQLDLLCELLMKY